MLDRVKREVFKNEIEIISNLQKKNKKNLLSSNKLFYDE